MRTFVIAPLLLFITSCATTAPTETAAPTSQAKQFLVRQPAFVNCELEAFVAFGIGRQATQFSQTKASLLSGPNVGQLQTSLINEWFKRMEVGSRDYAGFAAEHFYQCTSSQALQINKNANAAVCFARQEIPFLLYAKKQMHFTQEQALIVARRVFGSQPQEIYPTALIEQTAPMVYRVESDNGFYELRRFMFETCLFPNEWQAWWDSEHPATMHQ